MAAWNFSDQEWDAHVAGVNRRCEGSLGVCDAGVAARPARRAKRPLRSGPARPFPAHGGGSRPVGRPGGRLAPRNAPRAVLGEGLADPALEPLRDRIPLLSANFVRGGSRATHRQLYSRTSLCTVTH
jgi:hypothetical protein